MNHRNQLDLYRNRQPTPAEWRAAAESVRINPYMTPAEREKSAAYYEAQARKAEGHSAAA